MADKQDYYEVLGVSKTATTEEIKKAHRLIVMKTHPDMVRNKSEDEKKAAAEKFQAATEAEAVLTNPDKRSVYDRFGHAGLQNLNTSSTTSSGPSFADLAGPAPKLRSDTPEDLEKYFMGGNPPPKKETPAANTGTSSTETIEERRERFRKERMQRRTGVSQTSSPPADSSPPPVNTPSVTDAFRDVSEKVNQTAASLRGTDAVLPLDTLQRFRDNLQSCMNEVDSAIARARKNDGPQP